MGRSSPEFGSKAAAARQSPPADDEESERAAKRARKDDGAPAVSSVDEAYLLSQTRMHGPNTGLSSLLVCRGCHFPNVGF